MDVCNWDDAVERYMAAKGQDHTRSLEYAIVLRRGDSRETDPTSWFVKPSVGSTIAVTNK